MTQNINYDEKTIKKLSTKESLINSLSTYTTIESPIWMFSEIFFNATDELLNNANSNKKITITWDKSTESPLEKTHKIIVKDSWRGIPIKSLKSATGELHVTGKSGNAKKNNESAYKQSVGVNGLGAKLVSYLSYYAKYTVCRDWELVELVYKDWNQGNLKNLPLNGTQPSFTEVEFEPVNEYFQNPITFKNLYNLIKDIFFLLEDIEITLINKITEETFEFKNTKGLKHYYDTHLNTEEEELLFEPLVFKETVGDSEFDFTFSYHNKFTNSIDSGINGWVLKEWGTIVSWYKNLMLDVIKDIADFTWRKIPPLKVEHIMPGFIGFMHLFYNGYIKFEWQTKKKVLSTDFLNNLKLLKTTIVNKLITEPNLITIILDKVEKNYQVLTQLEKNNSNAFKEINKVTKKAKPIKLTDSTSNEPLSSELYIVEGDSAGGTMIKVREPKKHAILKLRWKPKNVIEDSIESCFKNQEIQTLISAMGWIGKEFVIEKLKYKKIIITADQDTDGFHIWSLLITFFHKFYPEIINKGYLYRCMTPLFVLTSPKEKLYFYTTQQKDEYVKKHKWSLKNTIITRFKGLGEMNQEQYKDFILWANQKLQKVTNKDAETNTQTIEDIMWKDAFKKWEFLQTYVRQHDDEIVSKKNEELSYVIKDWMKEYGDYVLENRAIPNVFDWLKNVNRRILWSMWKNGIKNAWNKRKVISIVWWALEYHPHGDSSVEGALVSMTTEWKNNIPLLEWQGNFGSDLNHEPAAWRYIEAKLSKFVEDVLFRNLTKTTTYWEDNYDWRLQEPLQFPSVIPLSLIFPQSGIAIGTTCDMPPFNLNEVCDALIAYVKKGGEINLNKYILWPDFPSGWMVISPEEVMNGNDKSFKTRANIDVVKEKWKVFLVIRELTYWQDYEKFKWELFELVNNKTANKNSSLRNEVKKFTDNCGKGKIEFLLELRWESDIDVVKEKLYKKTGLESNIQFKPKFLKVEEAKKLFDKYGLMDIIKDFVVFRKQSLNKYFQEKIDDAMQVLSNLDAKRIVIEWLDLFFKIVKTSNSRAEFIQKLMDNFRINESQANYIATSATQTLINSDFQDLLKKIKEIKEEITHYKELITNDEKKKEYMIDEWKEIKKKYGWERKTKIIQEDDIKKVNLNTVENKYEDKEYLIVATKNYILKTWAKRDINKIEEKFKEMNEEIIGYFNSRTMENVYVVSNTENGSEVIAIKNYQIEEDKNTLIQTFHKTPIKEVLGIYWMDKKEDYLFIYKENRGFRIKAPNIVKERKFKINKKELAYFNSLSNIVKELWYNTPFVAEQIFLKVVGENKKGKPFETYLNMLEIPELSNPWTWNYIGKSWIEKAKYIFSFEERELEQKVDDEINKSEEIIKYNVEDVITDEIDFNIELTD